MKTKTSILTALVALASGTGAMAQVYSQNVVGYVNVDVPAGLSMIANQLDTDDNTIAALLPSVPNFTQVYKWNGSAFDIATFAFGSWDQPSYTLNPGEGAFINVDSAQTLTFVGEVMQGDLVNSVPSGLSIRASQVPQAGGVDTLGLGGLSDFDQVLQWNGNGYDVYTYAFGSWSPSVPQVAVGESIFINAATGGEWDRTFSVN